MEAELDLLRQRVTSLKTENTRLRQIIEEIANLRIENTRLKQIIKQNRTTNDPSHSSVSPQRHIPLPINGHSNEDDSTDSVNLDQTQVQNSISPEVNSNNISEQIVDTSFNNAPNSGDKEINDFLDQKVKEKVSNMMRDINREKKLLRSNKDPTSRTQEALLSSQDTSSIESEQMPIDQDISEAPINQAQGTISSKITGTSTTVLKIPYNQKVEQGLTHELSVCAEDNDIKNNAIHGFSSDKPFNIQIPELSLEVILTESSR
ncbi:6201_t:CDS:1, partial [Entrophospora sp. SA101]